MKTKALTLAMSVRKLIVYWIPFGTNWERTPLDAGEGGACAVCQGETMCCARKVLVRYNARKRTKLQHQAVWNAFRAKMSFITRAYRCEGFPK